MMEIFQILEGRACDGFVEIVNSFVERLWMLDIKMKIGDFEQTAIDIIVERT